MLRSARMCTRDADIAFGSWYKFAIYIQMIKRAREEEHIALEITALLSDSRQMRHEQKIERIALASIASLDSVCDIGRQIDHFGCTNP